MEVVIERPTKVVEKPLEPRTEPVKRKKATVEDVEDSEDERDLATIRKTADELPFQNVEAMEEVPTAPTLPRRANPIQPETGKAKRRRLPKDTTLEDLANSQVLEEVRRIQVPIPLGTLVDSNHKIRKALAAEGHKPRRSNLVQTTEGGVLAAKASTFLVDRIFTEEEDSSDEENEPPPDRGENTREEPTYLVKMDSLGQVMGVLMFDTLPEIVTSANHELAEGSIIVGDPVLQYFDSLAPGEQPRDIRLTVAPMSSGLRCLLPTIKGIKVEAITDGGSQIVSIRREVAELHGLEWDPRIRITMQAANEGIQRSLGICRNVPFQFSNIILYIQVHVLESAPYDILLGRPFDVVAESIVASKRNGDVFITISDPYTGQATTMPTYPRGYLKDTENADASNQATNGSANSTAIPQDFRSYSRNSMTRES